MAIVREIFAESATYSINGKKTLSGLDEIVAYWERNQRRQRNIKIFPSVHLDTIASNPSCVFCAKFADIEENEIQTIYGHLNIQINDRKITSLTEIYQLIRDPSTSAQRFAIACDYAKTAWWSIKQLGNQIAEYMLVRGTNILLMMMAVVLGYSAFNIAALPDWALCGLTVNFSEYGKLIPERRAELVSLATHNLSTITSVFIFATVFIDWLRYKIRNPIQIIPLQAEGHDLVEMRKRFHKAKHLTIFAGDFSFIGSDLQLRNIFTRLDSYNSLMLISDKPEDKVRTGFGDEPDAIALFESLKRKSRIHFEKGVPIRCSVLRRWYRSEILYRYKGGSPDSLNDLHLCVLKGRKEAGPILDLVQKLAEKAAS